jgi:hypothetical protein
MSLPMLRLFRVPGLLAPRKEALLVSLRERLALADGELKDVETEFCFNVQLSEELSAEEQVVRARCATLPCEWQRHRLC